MSRDEAINKTMIFLNAVFPLLEGIGYLLANLTDMTLWISVGIGMKCVVGCLQIVSCVLLGYSINKVRLYAKANEQEEQINSSQLIVHIFAFGFYLLSTIVLYALYF